MAPDVKDLWPNSPGVPVMGAIFPNKNITKGELGDLQAFFKKQAEGKATSGSGKFVIIGILVFFGFVIIIAAGWSGRYRSRNQGTAHDALWRNYAGKGGK